ncbi:hypothetical protein, partial [Staphylococcus aureus]
AMPDPHEYLDSPRRPGVSLVERTPVAAVTDLELSAQHRAFLAAATSDNTRRTYRSAIRHFLAWGGMLPCDPDAIVRYLLAYASTLNPRTLAL